MNNHMKIQKYVGKMLAQWMAAAVLFAGAMLLCSYWDGLLRYFRKGELLEGLSFLFPLNLYICSMLIIPIMAGTMCKTYFPIYVSMGATRKKAFLYISEIHAGVMTAIFLLVNLLWRITGKNLGPEAKYMPVLVAGLIISGAVGTLIGGVILRFGMVASVILVVSCMGIGGIAGLVISFSGTDKMIFLENSGAKLFAFLPGFGAGVAALLAGTLIYGICSLVAWKLMKQVEVRV